MTTYTVHQVRGTEVFGIRRTVERIGQITRQEVVRMPAKTTFAKLADATLVAYWLNHDANTD